MSERYEKPERGSYTDRWDIVLNRNFAEIGDDVDQLFEGAGSPWYDVAVNDAAGDGSTDDTQAIQNAINQAGAAGGGMVFFPAGTYLISGSLVPADNVSLVGVSMGSSTIEISDDTQPILDCQNTSNITVSGLTFTQEAQDYNVGNGIQMIDGTLSDSRFYACEFRDSNRQAFQIRGDRLVISNCRFRRTGRDSIMLISVENGQVIGCYFHETGDDAIAFNDTSTHCMAVGNQIYGAGTLAHGSGIKVHGEDNLIIGNVIRDSNRSGIRLKERVTSGDFPRRNLIAYNIIDGLRGNADIAALGGIELHELSGQTICTGNIVKPYDVTTETNVDGYNLRGDDGYEVVIRGGAIINNSSYTNPDRFVRATGNIEYLEINGVMMRNGGTGLLITNEVQGGELLVRNCHLKGSGSNRFFRTADFGDEVPLDYIEVKECSSAGLTNDFSLFGNHAHGTVLLAGNRTHDHSRLSGETGNITEYVEGSACYDNR